MSKKTILPVLITGAGPVGLTLAVELNRYGIPFRIIDRRAARSAHSKAIGIHARTLEILETMGLIDKFLQAGQKITHINLYSQGKQLLQAQLGDIQSPYPFALNLPQSTTEHILEQHLIDRGVVVERNCELMALAQEEKKAQALVRHQDGREEKIEAAYIVGCDGVHSTVRQQIGLPFEGSDLEELFALADVSFATAFDRAGWNLFFHPAGFFLLFPLKDGHWRIVIDLKHNPQTPLSAEQLQQLAEERGVPYSAIDAVFWTSTFTIRHRKAPSYQSGRVFIAGDAAHVHSPAGAQGMNTGMQDAFNLAWKIAYVQKGLASADLLASYSDEREKIGREVLAQTDRTTRLATLRNPLFIRLRNALLPVLGKLGFIQEKVLNALEEMTVNYRDSALVGQYIGTSPSPVTLNIFREESPRAGDRAPDGTLTHALTGQAQRLYPLFACGTHTLLLFLPTGDDRQLHDDSQTEEILNLLAAQPQWDKRLIQTLVITGRHLPEALSEYSSYAYLDARASVHQHYGVKRSSAAYLIRPDGYIGFRSLPVRAQQIYRYLGTHYTTAPRHT